MNNVKLVALIAMLFLGVGNVNAQERSTVLIRMQYMGETSYRITTVEPDYTKSELTSSRKGEQEDSDIILKKELDKWIQSGYKIVSSTNSRTTVGTTIEIIYLMVKEDE